MTNRRNLWIGVGVAVVLLLLLGWMAGSWLWGRNAYGPGYGMYGMMGGYGLPWGMHSFGGGIMMLLFWALVLGGGALLIGGFARQESHPRDVGETPLEIARRRYASGEIDREEFERIRQNLLS